MPWAINRRTWRNISRAVVATSWIVCLEPLPGTVTTSRLLPCGWTSAPELPVPLTRDWMTETAAFISDRSYWKVLVTAFVALFFGEAEPFARPWDAVLGMCVGAGAISIAGWLGEVWLKRPAMGFGDVTLMAVAGAALGPARSLLTVFIGAAIAPIILLGIVYPLSAKGLADDQGQTELALDAGGNWRRRELPFGVFLAPAALIALLFGDAIIGWYLRISGL